MRHATPRRPGKILVMFVLVLTALLGMLGLVIDTGLMMAAHRRTQSAADSAALAAAMELMRGGTLATDPTSGAVTGTAVDAARQFVHVHNGMPDATVTVRRPVAPSPHAGSTRHVEVIVTRSHSTMFVQVVGPSQTQTVSARAVAGYEPLAWGEGAIVLDPDARPGLSVSGGAVLYANGAVIVNSKGAGYDQYGQTVDWGTQQYAVTTGNNSKVFARYIQVRGGVDIVPNYHDYEDYSRVMSGQAPTQPSPLFARAPISPDPLREVPVPGRANVSSITDWTRQPEVKVQSGETRSFTPGVYTNIAINKGANVTFRPGVYVFSPQGPNQGLSINGVCTVNGDGVMFYMTGSNYLDPSSGTSGPDPGFRDRTDDARDALDGTLPPTPEAGLPPPTDPTTPNFASFVSNATGATVNLTGLKDSSSPFDGILFFQRRRNTQDASIQGNAGAEVNLRGTIYAKWAKFKLAGGGKHDAQFVVGSMEISGQATVTINSTGKNFGRANQVFLME